MFTNVRVTACAFANVRAHTFDMFEALHVGLQAASGKLIRQTHNPAFANMRVQANVQFCVCKRAMVANVLIQTSCKRAVPTNANKK